MRSGNAVFTSIRRRSVAVVAAGGLVAAGLVAATTAQAADNIGSYEILAGASKAVMLDTDPLPVNLPDPDGSTKELGPVNGTKTKLVVIHDAAVPMLADTNPNGQVDLRDIWLGTSTHTDGDQYLYFAWERDSSNGSGVLMIEFQKAALGAECDYADAGFDPDLCNPWAGRQAGDFVLVWDQQGQDIDIIKRTFTEVNGVLVLDPGVKLVTAKAAVSGDGFFGEAAINLTKDVFGSGTQSCTTLANVIPGTVTGNSDTADYKDTVLALAPPISNCGTVTVKKVTDPAGDTDTSFTWTLDRADKSAINYVPEKSASDSIKDGETDTENDLIAGNNYNLAETDPGPAYAIKFIVCTDAAGKTYDAKGGGDFPVNAGETTACVITNKLQPGTLTVKKVLDYNYGGDAAVTTFKFDVAGPTSSSNNQFEADGSNDLTVDAGTYNVTETTIPTNYKLKSNTCTNVKVPAGESASCTITNEDIPATLKVVKVIKNDAGGTKKFEDFAFSVSGPTASSGNSFESDGDNELDVIKGTYTVTEDASLGYDVKYNNCKDVAIPYAGTATCTITNTYPQNAPTAKTVQSWILLDSFSAQIRPGAPNAGDAKVTFALFSDQQCTTQEGTDEVVKVTVSADGKEVSATTKDGYLVKTPGDYFWTAKYSGDAYNSEATSGCTKEITRIAAKDDGDLQPLP